MKYNFTLVTFLLLSFVLSLDVFGQLKTVNGRVRDQQSSEAIPGIIVSVRNTTLSTTTDEEGDFTLSIPDTILNLYFQGLGYFAKSVPVSDSMNVYLQEDRMILNEVVVTANNIVREKRSLGYATQEVTAVDLTKGQNTSALSALQGKVSGLNVTSTTGSAGGTTRIVLRGGTSLTGNNQALIVVDGIPIDNSNFYNQDPTGTRDASGSVNRDDLNNQVDYSNRGNDVNPNDIETINVLKGPAASALYGSRASNGAIIITTKGGLNQAGVPKKMEVNYYYSVTLSRVLKLPAFQNQYGQGDVFPGRAETDRRENFSWGLPFDGQDRPWGQQIDGEQQVKPYSAQPNNVKDFFQTGVTHNNHLSLTGGTDKTNYHLGVGWITSKGIIETTKTDRYNIRLKASTQLANNFTSTVSANYSNLNSELPTGGQGEASVMSNLIQSPRDIPITAGKDLDNKFNRYDDKTGKYGYYGAYITNPYFSLKNFRNVNKVDRIQGGITLSYTKFKWITFINRFGGDVYADRRYQRWKKYNYTPIDPFYDGNTKFYQGKYSEDIYNVSDIINDFMVNLQHDFKNGLKFYAILGHNIRQRTYTNNYAQTNSQNGLAIADYYNLSNSDGAPFAVNSYTRRRLLGVYADANLSYKNMLFLGITARNDWSSTLPANNNSYFYPSVNAAWVFTDMFRDSSAVNDIVSYGKLRGSIAKVGNDGDPYLTSTVFNKTTISGGFGNTTLPFTSVNGFTNGNRVGNPNLKPEITTAYEVGLELYFLKNRVGVDFSYYSNSSKNQIINVPVSNASGYATQTINAGEIQNRGVELLVRGTPILTTSGWSVELIGTYTRNKSKVVSIQEGVDQITLGGFSRMGVVAAVGKPYGEFYGVDLLKDPEGRVVVDPKTGIPLLTTNSVYLGNYQPKYIASLGTTISYKNLSLSAMFNTKQGGKMFSNTKNLMAFVGTSPETAEGGREDRVWENSVYQDENGNYVKNESIKYSVENYYTNFIPDGQHIIDASYVKFQELALTYVFPAKWMKRTPLGGASLGIFGNNLYVWTSKQNTYSDPEMNSSGASNIQGFEFSATPSQRNYGANIKITF